MAPGLAALIERLLEEVALCGTYGVESAKLRGIVQSFYDAAAHETLTEDASEDHVQVEEVVVDEKLLQQVRDQLEQHPDIEVRDDAQTASISSDPSNNGRKRFFTTRERMWQALAGHNVDPEKIPLRQFELLSVVGAAGPKGILQPESTRLLGADKHSVPRRTDILAEKGYIVKKSVVTGRQMTSLLTLKKFAADVDASHKATAVSRDPQGNIMFDYDLLFDEVAKLTKEQPSGLLAVDDLRLSLDIPNRENDIQALFSCVRRLAHARCFQTCSAASSHGLAKGLQPKIPCIQLVRNPTAEDKELVKIWSTGKMYVDKRPIYHEPSHIDDPDEGQKDGNDRLGVDSVQSKLRSASSLDVSLLSLIFRIVKAAGRNGASSQEVRDKASPHARRDVEHVLSTLTNGGRNLHAPGLKHLSIVQGGSPDGTTRYYTMPHLDDAVRKGRVSGISSSGAQVVPGSSPEDQAADDGRFRPLDPWGFTPVDPSLFEAPEHSSMPTQSARASSPTVEPLAGTDAIPRQKRTYKKRASITEADSTPRQKRPYKRRVSAAEPAEEGSTLHQKRPYRKRISAADEDSTHEKGPYKKRISVAEVVAPSDTTPGLRAPKLIQRPRVTSEKDQPEFARWAKATAENTVRLQVSAEDKEHDLAEEPARKKRKLSEPEPDSPVDRAFRESHASEIAKVETDLLQRNHPGIYMNPPGARDLKAQFYIQRGRPRNALIAAVKTDRLRSLPWFEEEQEAREAPFASRRRTKFPLTSKPRKGAQETAQTDAIAYDEAAGDTTDVLSIDPQLQTVQPPATLAPPNTDGQPMLPPAQMSTVPKLDANKPAELAPAPTVRDDSTTPETFDKAYTIAHADEPFYHVGNGRWRKGIRSAKKRKARESACSADELQPPAPKSLPVAEVHPVAGAQEPLPPDTEQPVRAVDTLQDHELQASTSQCIGANEQTSQKTIARTEPERPKETFDKAYVLAHRGETFHHVGNGRWKQGLRPTKQPVPAVSALPHADPSPTADPASASDQSGKSALVHPRKVATTKSKGLTNEHIESSNSPKPGPEPNGSIESIVQPTSAHSPARRRSSLATTPAQDGSDGFAEELSTTLTADKNPTRQRPRVIMDLIRQHGGMYPGNKELWGPFQRVWEAAFKTKPSMQAFDTAVKGLIDSRKLKKITFSFRSEEGMNETKSILAFQDIDATGENVAELKNAIIDAFPDQHTRKKSNYLGKVGTQSDKSQPRGLAFDAAEKSAELRRQNKPVVDAGRPFALIEGLTVVRTPLGLQHLKSQRLKEFHKNKKTKPSLEVKLSVTPEQLQLIQLHCERLRLSPGQEFHAPTGTFTTRGTIHAPTSLLKKRSRRVATPLTPTRVSEERKSKDEETGLSTEMVDKRYVSQRGPENFKHVGNGRWRRIGSAADVEAEVAHSNRVTQAVPSPTGDELYDKAYVQAHRHEEFHHVGNGRFRRGPKAPVIRPQPTATLQPACRQNVARVGNQVFARPAEQLLTQYQSPAFASGLSQTPQWRSSEASAPSSFHDASFRPTSAKVATSLLQPSPAYETRKRKVNYEQLARPDSDFESTEMVQRPQKRQKTKAASEFIPAEDIVAAIAIIKLLCAGLDQKRFNWELVAHALDFKYDVGTVRTRWISMAKAHAKEVERLQDALREQFLGAYENGELPEVDFQTLSNTDWPALTRWAKTIVPQTAPVRFVKVAEKCAELPATSVRLQERFEAEEPEHPHGPSSQRYFDGNTDVLRTNVALALVQGETVSSTPEPPNDEEDELALLKSWCRAVTITPPRRYNAEAAAQKISMFSDHLIQRANDELVADQVFGMEKKGRQLPGRNFYLSRAMLKLFERWPGDDMVYVRELVNAHALLVTHFAQNETFHLSYHVRDSEVAVLTNMVAQGHLKIRSELPERNDDPDAPFPRFSIWGVDDIKALYNSHEADPARLRFAVVYEKTATYTPYHGLKSVPIPTKPAQVAGEPGLRIPLWVDINGDVVGHLWDMVLRSVLHLAVYRPGSTAKSMAEAHEGKLWVWEVEMVLLWMEQVGLAISFGPGKEENGIWKGGWRASEWWYCAFAPDVATWSTPSMPAFAIGGALNGPAQKVKRRGRRKQKEVPWDDDVVMDDQDQ